MEASATGSFACAADMSFNQTRSLGAYYVRFQSDPQLTYGAGGSGARCCRAPTASDQRPEVIKQGRLPYFVAIPNFVDFTPLIGLHHLMWGLHDRFVQNCVSKRCERVCCVSILVCLQTQIYAHMSFLTQICVCVNTYLKYKIVTQL